MEPVILCNGTKLIDKSEHFEKVFKVSFDFEDEMTKPKRIKNSNYDCLLMLSGGKDSTHMLYKLIKQKLRPLAFTVNHPFESHNAQSNIKKVWNRLNIEHISYTPNLGAYKKLLKKVFTWDKQKIFDCIEEI